MFRKSRPFIRPFQPSDMGWLWAAYQAGSFRFEVGMSQEEFAETIGQALSRARHYIVEDDCPKFQAGRGPIGLVGIASDGAGHIEPNAAIFKWASTRNVLRAFVAFFQWVRNSREVESCEVKVPTTQSRLLRRMADYGVLFPRATEIVFSVRGKKGH